MPTRTAKHYLLATFLLFFGVGSGFAAPCPDTTEPIAISQVGAVVQIHGTLRIDGGYAFLNLTVDPCQQEINATGTADGNVMINTPQVSMIGPCEGPWDLTVFNVCGVSEAIFIIPPPTLAGGDDDDDDDGGTPGDDDDDDDNGGGGGVAEQLPIRSPRGNSRPTAKLIDIDVDVNPAVVKLDDLGANLRRESNEEINDVTFTARLVFSGGVIPEEFRHHTRGWEFWPIQDGENNTRSQDGWSGAMEQGANLKFNRAWVPGLALNEGGEQEDAHDKLNVNVYFKVLPGSAQGRTGGGRVETQKVPVRVLYKTPDGQEFTKVVNVQVERKSTSGSFGGSSGPSSRIVTYSRVLE